METTMEINAEHSSDVVATAAVANKSLVERLLSMAQQYQSEGSVQQATEIYWTLVDSYSGTTQADTAKAVLLELAETYERNGARRMARSMYERLED